MKESTNTNKIKRFTSRMQARLLLVFCVVTLILVGLIGRLIYIMQTDGERYAKQVLSRQSYVRGVLPYKRGEILDRNGAILARSELRYRLLLDPENLLINSDKIPTTLAALKEYYGIEADTVNTILKDSPNSRYKILLDNLQLSEVEDFKKLIKEDKNVKSLWFEEKYVRNYPYNTIACDILGFTSVDNKGYWGIEEYYNDELNGINGKEFGYYDSSLNIERIIKKPEHGNTIVSTIDVNAQRIVQKHISQFNEDFGSLNIGVLVMDPNNGDIIAMASNEEYDLNSPQALAGIYSKEELATMSLEEKIEAMNKLWKNDIISLGFEPGSTFKPFTVAVGLEEAFVSENSTFLCDGVEHVGGWDIRCSARHGHGNITLAETLIKSCNDAMMHIVDMVGRDNFYRYQKYFSFGQTTGIDLPGEESGILIALDNLNASELATSSFGQTFTATMLQMAAGYSSLVNGGYYYQPRVVKEILNDQNATVKKIEPLLIRRTVSEKTSEFIQETMYQTVELGTAKHAKVEGYTIGGKTGTAEKLPRGSDTYIVSFLGASPAINPEIVIYVVIDEPQNVPRQDNSSIATQLTSRIMNELLPALGIYPEGEIDYLLGEELNDNSEEDTENEPSHNSEEGTNEESEEGSQGESNQGDMSEDTGEEAQSEPPNNTEENQSEPSNNTEETQSESSNDTQEEIQRDLGSASADDIQSGQGGDTQEMPNNQDEIN